MKFIKIKDPLKQETKETLEKKIFGCSFDKLRLEPCLLDLNLSDKEIIDNYEDIAKVINSYYLCNNDTDFCQNFDDHYMLIRKLNTDLHIKKFDCNKNLYFQDVKSEQFKAILSKFIIYSDIELCSKEEFKEFINSWVINELFQKLQKIIARKKNFFDITHFSLTNKILITAYLITIVITQKNISIISSREFKNIIFNNEFNFNKNTDEHKKSNLQYQSLIKSPYLIIYDLGLEDSRNISAYWVDFLLNIIRTRKSKQLKTILISEFSIKDLNALICSCPRFNPSLKINMEKLKKLNSIFYKD